MLGLLIGYPRFRYSNHSVRLFTPNSLAALQNPMPPYRTASNARIKFSSPCGLTDRFLLVVFALEPPLRWLVDPDAEPPSPPVGDWIGVVPWLYTDCSVNLLSVHCGDVGVDID